MTLFVYVTDSCQQDAKRHSVQTDIDRIRANVEESQSLSLFDPFPPPYLVKKKLHGRQHRLVADYRRIGEHSVVVFLAVMIRGGKDYEQEFSHDPVAYGRQHFQHLVESEVLERYVAERSAMPEVPRKPDPSQGEYELLYSSPGQTLAVLTQGESARDSSDRIICETHRWVERTLQPKIQGQLNRLNECCVEATAVDEGLHFLPAKEKAGWGIWAYRHADHVLLIDVVDGAADSNTNRSPGDEVRSIAESIRASGTEALLQASKRAYPDLVLTDEQLWLELEREEQANMALSPEETKVLASAWHSVRPYPLFINGRAGSGKSTILQYLFADLLFTFADKFGVRLDAPMSAPHKPGHPLYLTANGELLRVARGFVERLLKSEVRFSGLESGQAKPLADELHGYLDRVFREFRPFLIDLVDPSQRHRFLPAKRVDYRKFRTMWDQRFGKDPKTRREFGPDLSWHVIRSYIKGMGSEDLLTPEDYRQLPENQISVTEEAFEGVYNHIWMAWYSQLAEEGYWDDQDLARHILDNDRAPRSYSAVFCDEAQDFTRLELEVLLRLNLFSHRNLPNDAVNRVPFAFAGDEFQTLNPTGFRWDAVKASFVEKFIYELDPGRRGEKADLNYHELRFNYRSAAPIVRISNLVQALRSALFGISELQPQRPWMRDSEGAPALYFSSADGAFWSEFREHAAGYVVIVPCAEGEEAHYVASNPALQPHIELTDDGLPRNVLSASRAKGCEYPAVIVYGFGEALDLDLMARLGAADSMPEGSSRSLSLQYYINRLYVAVSRPKRRLVIVDTEAGKQRLWKAAFDESARERLLSAVKRGAEVWESHVGGLTLGRPGDLGSENVPDRLENARTFEGDGRARRDSYLMMQAASLYREAGDLVRARICKALASDYDDRPFDAGVAYAEAGLLDDARRCLWRAERNGWLRLAELAREHPEQMGQIEVRWVKAILDKPDPLAAAEVLELLADRIDHDSGFAQRSGTDPAWQQAMDALLGRLVLHGSAGVPLPALMARRLLAALDRVVTAGVSVPETMIPELAFASGDFSRAAEHWERQGERRSPRYLEAKARALPFPSNADYFRRLGRLEDVARGFDTCQEAKFGDADAEAVVDALIQLDRLDDALLVARSAGSGSLALDVAARAFGKGAGPLAQRAFDAAVEYFVARAEWQHLAQIADRGAAPSRHPGWKESNARQWYRERCEAAKPELVRLLARSEKLPDAAPKDKQQIGRFLSDYLLAKGGQWKPHVTHQEAGAAIERAGKLTDALQFYEAAMEEPMSGELVREMQLRWIAVKHRQLELERRRDSNSRDVHRLEQDLRRRMQGWHLSRDLIGELTELPVLTGIKSKTGADGSEPNKGATGIQQAQPHALGPVAQAVQTIAHAAARRPDVSVTGSAADGVNAHDAPAGMATPRPAIAPRTGPADEVSAPITLGRLRIELRRSRGLCLVTDTDSMDAVKIDWLAGTVTSAIGIEQRDGNWRVEDWGLLIELPSGGPSAIRLSLPSLGLTIEVARG